MTKIIIGTTPTITYKFKAPFYSVGIAWHNLATINQRASERVSSFHMILWRMRHAQIGYPA